jgi:thioredoxin reductase (NADPH)
MNAPPLAAAAEVDAVVVGSGPVGLFQVFQLGLLGIHSHVLECLPHPGGQCTELYPDKPIYDIPAVTVCTGHELTQRLLQQIAPFHASMHFGHEVRTLTRQADRRFLIETSQGLQLVTKTVFIAAGVGAFKPRTLPISGLESFTGSQVFYAGEPTSTFAGQQVVVVGGDDAALQQALQLCHGNDDNSSHKAASVTLLHRRDVLQATDERVQRMHALCASGTMRFMVGQITGLTESEGKLTHIEVLGVDGLSLNVPLNTLSVQLGLSPKLGPIADWGLAMERRQLQVDAEHFSTSEPGIFAVGDINTYPGKKKLILCGFHEATLAAYAAAEYVFPDKRLPVQYTTTSPSLQQLLGVASRMD